MYGYGYYGWGMDPTILLLVIGMLLSLAASAKLRSTFAVYKKVGVIQVSPVRKLHRGS